METYQAIFDAVRSKLSNTDVGHAVESAVREANIPHYVERIAASYQEAVTEQTRPSVLFRPQLYIDGDQWCALYGEDLQNGVAGFGRSPYEAMAAFDCAWHSELSNHCVLV